MEKKPSLYGIKHTNRIGNALWGKNQFNSTFPVAMACFMRDQGIPAVHIKMNENLETECTDLSIDDMFNTKLPNDELFFDFESRYEPFEKLHYEHLERVDLVIREKAYRQKGGETIVVSGKALRALEIKLTVVPDNTTHKLSPSMWAPEIVIRPATMMYCALGMAAHADIPQNLINEIFLPVGKGVIHWGNEAEAMKILPHALDALDNFQKQFYKFQSPLVMQPIWRTKSKQPILDDNAFDIFVWSDFALARVFINLAKKESSEGLSRHARAALRLTRFLYEYGRAGSANIDTIFADMTYKHQSDKEASLSGRITSKYMKHSRLEVPILKRDIVKNIILNGGQRYLSPERRFDQTIYFTYEFEEEIEEVLNETVL